MEKTKIETVEEIFKRLKPIRDQTILKREFRKYHKALGEDDISRRILVDLGLMDLYRIGAVIIKGEEIELQPEMHYHG